MSQKSEPCKHTFSIFGNKEYIFATSTPKMRMSMKKIFLLLLVLSLCLFGLSGCDDSASGNDTIYKIELGAISNDTYSTAMNRIQNLVVANYDEIHAIRNYLHENTVSDYQIQNGVSSVDIEEFMQSRNFSNYQISNEMDFLQRNGNDILFFEHAFDNNKKIWMYITK